MSIFEIIDDEGYGGVAESEFLRVVTLRGLLAAATTMGKYTLSTANDGRFQAHGTAVTNPAIV